jgi:hypothetical protein
LPLSEINGFFTAHLRGVGSICIFGLLQRGQELGFVRRAGFLFFEDSLCGWGYFLILFTDLFEILVLPIDMNLVLVEIILDTTVSRQLTDSWGRDCLGRSSKK